MSAVDATPEDASLLLDLGGTPGKAGMMPQAEARESLTHFLALAPSRYDRQIGVALDRLAQLQ